MKIDGRQCILAVLFCVTTVSAQVTGSGTPGFLSGWKTKTSLTNSLLFQAGSAVGLGTKTPSAKLDVESSSTNQPAILGNNSATSGTPSGVTGLANFSSGNGVFGFNSATSGGNGVFGISIATSGFGNGVNGQTSSPNGQGVFGTNTATSGYAAGVTGTTASSNGPGVNGFSTSATGGFGVVGAAATNGTAIFGINQFCTNGVCPRVAGIAGLFDTGTGGTVLLGQANDVSVFRVDDTGKGFFDGGTQTGGADFAESVAVAKSGDHHEPGDLLVIDTAARRQLKLASEPYSQLVAGIYSTKPGVLATTHRMDESTANEIPLAIVGIVPCKVSAENGAIQPGDLLVTSSTPGYAMKGTDRSKMLGAVVGKALEPLSDGKALIQVLVTLQ
jgi:trimeric autotransporter adhesin